MPYGLPGLDAREVDTIARWLQSGAPYEGDVPLTAVQRQQVAGVGSFPQRAVEQGAADEPLPLRALVRRAPLLRADAARRSFRVVRSTTPPGEPVQRSPPPALRRARRRALLVPARARSTRPSCARRTSSTRLSPERMRRVRGSFLDAGCSVDALPCYDIEVASTPSSPSTRSRPSALPVHARRRAVLHHDLHPRAGVPRAGGGRRHRGPLLRRLPRPGCHTWRPDPTLLRQARPELPAEHGPPRAGEFCLQYGHQQKRFLDRAGAAARPSPAAQAEARLHLGRRRPQPERAAHGLPPLRQRLGGARLRRRRCRRPPGSSTTRCSSASTTSSSPATTSSATSATS